MARVNKRLKAGTAVTDMPPTGPFPFAKGSMNEQHVDLDKGGIHILIKEYGVVNRTACQHCIGGHRVKGCKHWFRVLRNAKRAGRPLTHCDHVTDCGEACTEDATFVCIDPPEYYELSSGMSVRVARYMGQQPKQQKSVDRVSKSSTAKPQKDRSTPSTKVSSRSTSDSVSPKAMVASHSRKESALLESFLPISNVPLSHCANGVCQCGPNCSCLGCEVHGNVLPSGDPDNSCECQDSKSAELCLPLGNMSSVGCASAACQCGPKCSCVGCKTHGNVTPSDEPANPCACQTCQCYSEVVIHATAGPEHDRRQFAPQQGSGCCSSKKPIDPMGSQSSPPHNHFNAQHHYPLPHASTYAPNLIPTSGLGHHHSQTSVSSHPHQLDNSHLLDMNFAHYDSIDPNLLPDGLNPSPGPEIPFPFTSVYLQHDSNEVPPFLNTEGLDTQSEYGFTSPYDIIEPGLSLFDSQFGQYNTQIAPGDLAFSHLPDPGLALGHENMASNQYIGASQHSQGIVKKEANDDDEQR